MLQTVPSKRDWLVGMVTAAFSSVVVTASHLVDPGTHGNRRRRGALLTDGFDFLGPLQFRSRNLKTYSLNHADRGRVKGLEGGSMAGEVCLFHPFPSPSSFSPLGSLVNQDRCCSQRTPQCSL